MLTPERVAVIVGRLLNNARERNSDDDPAQVRMMPGVTQRERQRSKRLAPTGRDVQREEAGRQAASRQAAVQHAGADRVDARRLRVALLSFGESLQRRPQVGKCGLRLIALGRLNPVAQRLCSRAIGVDEAGEQHPREEREGESHLRVAGRGERKPELRRWLLRWPRRGRDRVARRVQPVGEGGSPKGVVRRRRIRQARVVARDAKRNHLPEHVLNGARRVSSAKRGMIHPPLPRRLFRRVHVVQVVANVSLKLGRSLPQVMPQPRQAAPVGGGEGGGKLLRQGRDLVQVVVEPLPIRLLERRWQALREATGRSGDRRRGPH